MRPVRPLTGRITGPAARGYRRVQGGQSLAEHDAGSGLAVRVSAEHRQLPARFPVRWRAGLSGRQLVVHAVQVVGYVVDGMHGEPAQRLLRLRGQVL